MSISPASLQLTAEGIPYSDRFDDIYHSQAGGLGQAHAVFLAGNGLPQRWHGRDVFAICETGFGLGLNFLATWASWQADPAPCQRLHYVACELHPFTAADLQRLHAGILASAPALLPLSAALIANWPLLIAGSHRIELANGRVVLTLLFGDALASLGQLAGKFDAFYLDGFAPAKNPTMWQLPLFKQLARLSALRATVATYTAAGAVRRALESAGFAMTRRPGYAGKLHCLAGEFRGERLNKPVPPQHAIVLGAGLAGSAIAERLAQRGWRVTMLERHASPAQGASGNHAGAYRPVVSLDDNLQTRLARAAFLYGLRHMQGLPGLVWQSCGALQLARDEEEGDKLRWIAQHQAWPESFLEWVDVDAASALAGQRVSEGGLWFSQGGWVKPTSLVNCLLLRAKQGIETRYQANVDAIAYDGTQWHAFGANGERFSSAPVLILANAADANRFAPELQLSTETRAVSLLDASCDPAVKVVVCGGAYLTPAHDGLAALGSSPASGNATQQNLQLLQKMLPDARLGPCGTHIASRVCARPNTIDRMPIAGPILDLERWLPKHAGSLHLAPRRPGLFTLTGFGARGLVWCSLLAETLASQICGEPLPIERDLANAIDPARFIARHGLVQSSDNSSQD